MPGGFHDSENVEYMRENGIHTFFGAVGGAGQGQYQTGVSVQRSVTYPLKSNKMPPKNCR